MTQWSEDTARRVRELHESFFAQRIRLVHLRTTKDGGHSVYFAPRNAPAGMDRYARIGLDSDGVIVVSYFDHATQENLAEEWPAYLSLLQAVEWCAARLELPAAPQHKEAT